MTIQKTLLTASPQVVAERAHVAKILSELGDADRVLGQSAKSRRARTRAIELLIDGDQVKVIRRRENYDDLIAAELV